MQREDDIPTEYRDMIVQEYIEKPLLVDKKKFDMRFYVMLKGIDEIEIYLCKEGMARFCT